MTNQETFVKLDNGSFLPNKAHSSDAGFDVTAIGRKTNLEKDELFKPILFRTGIYLQPPEGFYFELVARSSLQKYGYMLANSVGIIDNSYRGEIFVALIKFNPDLPDLELPMKIAQLIPKKVIEMNLFQTDDLTKTERGSGGFGSTGK